jgi:hypothetical protein
VLTPLLLASACHRDSDEDNTNHNGNINSNADGGVVDAMSFDACVTLTETATPMRGPADVIFVIDNTPSMEDELAEVRANMNAFSQKVHDDGLDLHIVLISCLPEDCGSHDNWHGICVEPPVGAVGGCPEGGPYDDSNPPAYLHVSTPVPSRGGLSAVVSTHDQWGHMIRDNSAKHVVVVSDDSDDWTAQQFIDAFVALDSRFEGFQAHGIYSFMSKEDACAISDTEPCCIFAAPDGEGTVYRDLVEATGGISGDMCLQDFDPVFDVLAGAVVESAELSCEWTIPAPPDGESLNPAMINVEFINSQQESYFIGRVFAASDCGNVAQGWYYDDAVPPTTIYVCPQTCTWIKGDPGARMVLHFGCDQYVAPVL